MLETMVQAKEERPRKAHPELRLVKVTYIPDPTALGRATEAFARMYLARRRQEAADELERRSAD
jgi:hypothetical protein